MYEFGHLPIYLGSIVTDHLMNCLFILFACIPEGSFVSSLIFKSLELGILALYLSCIFSCCISAGSLCFDFAYGDFCYAKIVSNLCSTYTVFLYMVIVYIPHFIHHLFVSGHRLFPWPCYYN